MSGPPGMSLGMMPPPPNPMHMLGHHNGRSNYMLPPPPPPPSVTETNISGFYPQAGSMMSPPPAFNQVSRSEGATIEKPRVVYSAAPVRRVVPTDTTPSMSADTSRLLSETTTTISATMTVSKPPQISLPGIQLNVPVEEIASERLKATGAVSHVEPAVVAGTSKMEVDTHPPAEGSKKEKKEKKKKFVRMAAGTVWEDLTLSEWDPGLFATKLFYSKCFV